MTIIARYRHQRNKKSRLFNLGLYAFANGHMQMVQALTTILQRRALRHA
jgi:hypothetical protein